ncbi:response regulator [Variovorax sp. YR752]|uniref:response regulator n=1 Tax=Variovorax sp. YR752 TaxID=1884383 RepID=UPI00313795CC
MTLDPFTPLPDGPAGSVLCIEDDPICRQLVEGVLAAKPRVRLLQAASGREGVAAAQRDMPDVVLLDMHLPDIGGLEVVRALSEPISQNRLHVILLTADSFSIDVVKAMSLGAKDYWPKPIDAARLLAGVDRALAEVAARRARSGA